MPLNPNSPPCGAKTRSGDLCQNPPMPNGRCRMHGGLNGRGPDCHAYKNGKYSAWLKETFTTCALGAIVEIETRRRSAETRARISPWSNKSPIQAAQIATRARVMGSGKNAALRALAIGGDMKTAAQAWGISRATLYRKLANDATLAAQVRRVSADRLSSPILSPSWEYDQAEITGYTSGLSPMMYQLFLITHGESERVYRVGSDGVIRAHFWRSPKSKQDAPACGAKTRKGTPCRCRPEVGRDRCNLHGGKSTGPKTEAGREAIRESNRRRAEATKLRR